MGITQQDEPHNLVRQGREPRKVLAVPIRRAGKRADEARQIASQVVVRLHHHHRVGRQIESVIRPVWHIHARTKATKQPLSPVGGGAEQLMERTGQIAISAVEQWPGITIR
ncbi:hypothetical protein D3C73_1391170 [compost metagenome]